MDSKHHAVLTALVYSDLFASPLTIYEVKRYLGRGGEGMTLHEVRGILRALAPLVVEHKGYYALRGSEASIAKRSANVGETKRKREHGRRIAHLLRRIPSIRFIGLSGGVAAGNAAPGDDIDLFIITEHNRLFITRFLVLLLLHLTGNRRRRLQTAAADKICANFFLDEAALAFPASRHDLYTAREMAQLIPLYDRGATYRRLFRANQWVQSILPQATPRHTASRGQEGKYRYLLEILLCFPFWEVLLKRLQLRLIRAHLTNETVTDRVLAFHPRDYRARTLRQFQRQFDRFLLAYVLFIKQEKTPSHFLDKAENIFYTA